MKKLTVLLVIVLAKIPGDLSRDVFKCHGDICNSGTEDQFCSATFLMCRDCNQVRDDCGGINQPKNCTIYCSKYLAELQLKKEAERTCDNLPVINDGVINQTNTTTNESLVQGTTVTFQCKSGYRVHFPSALSCVKYGQWLPAKPTCEAVTCTLPPVIMHGKRTLLEQASTYKLNTSVTYTCDDGYKLYGSSILQCSKDGLWLAYNGEHHPVCIREQLTDLFFGVSAVVVLEFFVILGLSQQIRRMNWKLSRKRSHGASLAELDTINTTTTTGEENPANDTHVTQMPDPEAPPYSSNTDQPSPAQASSGKDVMNESEFIELSASHPYRDETKNASGSHNILSGSLVRAEIQDPTHTVNLEGTRKDRSENKKTDVVNENGLKIVNHVNLYIQDGRPNNKTAAKSETVSLDKVKQKRSSTKNGDHKLPTQCTETTVDPRQPEMVDNVFEKESLLEEGDSLAVYATLIRDEHQSLMNSA